MLELPTSVRTVMVTLAFDECTNKVQNKARDSRPTVNIRLHHGIRRGNAGIQTADGGVETLQKERRWGAIDTPAHAGTVCA
jgi:hypothetical protein